jgi:MFS family permease
MSRTVRWRLAGMMALVYAVQGAFWPLLAVHLRDLGIDGRARGWIFATMALGSCAMPLGAGQLVDRLMPAQHFLSLSYALGTGFLLAFALGITTQGIVLFFLFLLYWLIVAPSYSMSAALAMRNLNHPGREFGGVRLWGTVGWMLVGWLVSGVMAWSGTARTGGGASEAFWLAAGFSLLLAGYSLTLPHTPPLATGDRGILGSREAIDLVRRPPVGVFLVTAFGVYLTMPFVYQVMPPYLESRGLPRAWVSSAMTLGQWPEIATLAVLPWLLRRLGYKGTLAIGIGAWAVRYGILALDPPLVVAVVGIPLHGIGIACFTVGGQVFLDSQAPIDRRASTQGLFVVMTSGLGVLLGSLLAGEIVDRFAGDYVRVYLIPCVIDLALLIYFCAGFRPDATNAEWADATRTPRPWTNDAVRGATTRVGNLVTESADG